MDENFLTEGTFQSSMDEIMAKRFGEKYTLEDVGDMVEFTEMTLEDRMDIVVSEITNDFTSLSKSLDDIQKSLYDMFGMLVDSQTDLSKSGGKGGITDSDVKKIVDGLKLEEKFFPQLYRYLDERFGLDADKIKDFRERTARVMGIEEAEGDEREGRTQSTADINRRTDKNPTKKSTEVGRRAFEDQAVFGNRLRMWTEGHKEPSNQKTDDREKKNKTDDESLISKIIKVGMIAGMLREIISKSPDIFDFIGDKLKGFWDNLNKEGGFMDTLTSAIGSAFTSLWDNTIYPWIENKFDLGKEWFKENFPELYDTLSYLTQLATAAYYASMSKEQQDEYVKANPNSDLAMWQKGTNKSKLDWVDIFQFATVTSGRTGDYVRGLNSQGRLEKFSDALDLEDLSDSLDNIKDFRVAFGELYRAWINGRISGSEFAGYLSLVPFDSMEMAFSTEDAIEGMNYFQKYGVQIQNRANMPALYTNIQEAFKNFIDETKSKQETIKNANVAATLEVASERRAEDQASAPAEGQPDNRSEYSKSYDEIMGSSMSEAEKAGALAQLQREEQYGQYSTSHSLGNIPTQGGAFTNITINNNVQPSPQANIKLGNTSL